MNLSPAYLKTLTYDRIKVTIRLLPAVKRGKMTFDLDTKVNGEYSFVETDDKRFFVPCLVVKQPVAKMVFADTYVYEQVKRRGDYGTYSMVPKRIPSELTHRFFEVPSRFPTFEGFFTTVYDVRRGWRDLKQDLVGRVLPLNCVNDAELVSAINDWNIEDHYMPPCDDGASTHTYSFDFDEEN